MVEMKWRGVGDVGGKWRWWWGIGMVGWRGVEVERGEGSGGLRVGVEGG